MANAWITPRALPTPGTYCRRLLIPLQVDFLAIVAGALDELRFSSNFEQVTGITPQQTADLFQTMLDAFMSGKDCMLGQIVAYATANPPIGSLPCDGASHLRTDFPDLYAAIDPFYVVDADHFTVPDLRGRTIIGVGNGPGLTPRSLGDLVGEENHALTIAELAAHTHTDAGHTHTESGAAPTIGAAITGVPVPSAIPAVGITGVGSAALSTDGGGQGHNNVQPSNAINYAIIAS